MTLSSLTFASLLLAAMNPAVAATPDTYTTENAAAASPAPSLAEKWKLSVQDGVLVATLTLVNTGSKSATIAEAYGHNPGTYVSASIDGSALDAVLTRPQELDMMSRMGPMPKFGTIAAGKEYVAGTYKFTLPAGYKGKTVHLEATTTNGDGTELTKSVEMALTGTAGAV